MKPCPFCGSLDLDFVESGTLLDLEDGSSMGPKAEPAVKTNTLGIRAYCYQCGAMGPRTRACGAWIERTVDARQLWDERTGTDANP